MNPRFGKLVEGLEASYQQLRAMKPVTIGTSPPGPVGGIYLFSEQGRPLYVGRTKRKIKDRLRYHVSPSAKDSPFALRLAREVTGRVPSYKREGSLKELLRDPTFKDAYDQAKARIRKMDVRFVAEPDPLRQALLEVYVAVVTGAKYNSFDTH